MGRARARRPQAGRKTPSVFRECYHTSFWPNYQYRFHDFKKRSLQPRQICYNILVFAAQLQRQGPVARLLSRSVRIREDNFIFFHIWKYGPVAQLGARSVRIREVVEW